MNRRVIMPTALAVLVITAGWYFLLWKPTGHKLSAARMLEASAATKKGQLDMQVASLRAQVAKVPSVENQVAGLEKSLPSTISVDTLIDQISAVAAQTGVTWSTETQSVAGGSTSSSASSSTGGVTPVSLAISVSGTYPQVLTFVRQLQLAPRIIKVSSLSVGGGGGSTSGGGSSSTSGGSTVSQSSGTLSISVTATTYFDSSTVPKPPKSVG